MNGAEIRTRACPDLAIASVFATTPEMFDGADAEAFGRVSGAAKLTRFGADCYAYGLCATGFVDAVVEAQLKPWDYCAPIPVIEGAGGIVTDWQGRRPGLGSDGRIVACGDPALHAAILARLADGA